jgi:hypothetical protein
MANASPRDTRAGFDIYRSAGGAVSLGELNAELVEAGYGPVSERTFTHYRKLMDAGFNRYIAINRFDVARAAEPFEGASADARYAYIEADLGVRVVFAKANKLLETFGRATQQGEVGALLRFEEQEVIEGLRKLKPQSGDMVTVRYLEAGRTAGGRVVEADVKSQPATIEIEYARLLSIAKLEVGVPLRTSDARFVLQGHGEDDKTLDIASRRIYHFFELIEGIRALSNRASARQAIPTYAEPPVLRSLSVASPAEIVILLAEATKELMPWGLVAGVLKAAAALPEKRKQWHEGTGQKKDNQTKDFEFRQRQLLVEQQKLEAALTSSEADLTRVVTERVRETFADSAVTDDEIAQYVREFVLPPLRALGATGIDDLGSPDSSTGPSTA